MNFFNFFQILTTNTLVNELCLRIFNIFVWSKEQFVIKYNKHCVKFWVFLKIKNNFIEINSNKRQKNSICIINIILIY